MAQQVRPKCVPTQSHATLSLFYYGFVREVQKGNLGRESVCSHVAGSDAVPHIFFDVADLYHGGSKRICS